MKRHLDVTPQARRDIAAILEWYRQSLGPRAARKVAETIRTRLGGLELGRVKGSGLVAGSPYLRAVAKRHVIIFLADDSTIRIVRIVHGAQDLEAVAATLSDKE